MPLSVSITIKGDKEIIAKLRRLESGLSDWSSELGNVGDMLMDVYGRQSFATSGGVIGASWPRLSPTYELWKAKNYPGRGILQRKGDLEKGFSRTVTARSLILENTVSYAKYHQFGTSRMPMRKVIAVNPFVKGRIVDIFKAGITRKLAKIMS